MRDFITCLEFLTRLRFSHRTEWHDDDFSRSVPYFPLVGLVMGLFMGAVNYGLLYLHTPNFMRAVLLVLAELLIIGALMYDGFMDTSDGVFSARDRERMLEIMKDSHVGSNAVIALVCLVLLKVAAYTTLEPLKLTYAFVAMFVFTRTFMVGYIVNYKYARKTGIGHMFKAYAKPVYTYIAFGLCIALVYACGLPYLYTAVGTFIICQGIAQFLKGQLGGLTGDTYGFLTECGVVIYLMLATYLV
ncbi:MAG: adenosylcobinamide-GDP ribazoletransferase, partial [Phascolarctobacterium sp.]|nr:adenosylcobinamide-GDP ribazoletransferase [Phascolarctobacterium sp.]